MKRILLITLALALASPAYARMSLPFIGTAVVSGETPTDYTNDANCIAAFFMNSAGDETDQTGNGNTLTEGTAGDIPTSSDVPSGYSGTSRDFDNDDDEGLYQADGGDLDISGNQDFSLVAWVKAETAALSMMLIGKYTSTLDNRQYQIGYRTDSDSMNGYVSADGTNFSKAIGATTTIDDGNWHHVAMVFNYDAGGSTITIYVDGDEDTNSTNNPKSHTGGIYDGDAIFGLGAAYSTAAIIADSTWDGKIDEVGVFDRVLSESEIEEIMATGLDGSNGGNDS
jgi:hypothetical protein